MSNLGNPWIVRAERSPETTDTATLIAYGRALQSTLLLVEEELQHRLRCGQCQRRDHLACEKRGPGTRKSGGPCCCLRSWGDLAGLGTGGSR